MALAPAESAAAYNRAMPSGKTKAIVGAAAVAVGGLGVFLVKHGPKRQAYRAERGWQPAIAKRSSMKLGDAEPYAPPEPKAKPIEPADPKPKPGLIGAAKEVAYEFSNDDVMTQAAALAFYAGLAFAPLITVALWVMRLIYKDEAQTKVTQAIGQIIGPQASEPLKQVLEKAKPGDGPFWAGIISIALVAFSASGVFGQVQSALNSIWHVQPKPTSGLMGFIKKRTLSLGMLASILFLLMTSLIVSVGLEAVLKVTGGLFGAVMGQIANQAVSIGLFTVLFAALFRFVPDAKIAWKPVWIGAAISAVLFTVGKYGLSIYLGHSDYESSYGAAAGSLIALLAWVYYSSIIVLAGAEVTEVTARRLGHAVEPDEHAVLTKQVEI